MVGDTKNVNSDFEQFGKIICLRYERAVISNNFELEWTTDMMFGVDMSTLSDGFSYLQYTYSECCTG